MPRTPVPRLHLVTDDAVVARADFLEVGTAALAAGGTAVALHLRSARAGGARLYALAAGLASAARGAGAAVFVNDRVDVALAAGCAGVQLGSAAMAVPDARAIARDLWIGASVHSAAEARARAADGADLLLAGSVYETASHPGRAAVGAGWLRELAELGAPVIAIGGVTPERVPAVLAAGARGVAVIGGVWGAASPVAAVGRYLDALEGR